jgi:hypothetical protein
MTESIPTLENPTINIEVEDDELWIRTTTLDRVDCTSFRPEHS